jgi:hypothetical protein
MITLQTGKPINIALPYLYKYMDEEFIDLFFNKGILRISSFKKFREYPDEIRGDKREGSGAFNTKTKEGSQFLLMTDVGRSEYMFSTSLILDDSIKTQFKTNSCFKIIKPLEFSAAITNSLAGSTQAFLGFCNYQDNRILQKQIDDFSINEFTDDKGNFIIGGPKMNQRTNEIIGNGIDLLYLKENKYQSQAEFRFVWSINTKYFSMYEHLDIECKEAVDFCEKVDTIST